MRPRWQWAWILFRIADGMASGLISIEAIRTYGVPVWASIGTVATMNLVSVPATAAWSRIVAAGQGRRRVSVLGFGFAGFAVLVMSLQPPFPWFVAAAAAWAGFGVATAPAASVLVMEQFDRERWSTGVARMSRTTTTAYLGGLALVATFGFADRLDASVVFLAAAFLAWTAATVAWNTIAPWRGPARSGGPLPGTGRAVERGIWLPGRAVARRFLPDWPFGARRVLAGILLIFLGTSMVLAGFGGVLVARLGASPAMALVAQLPAPIATILSFSAAGRKAGSGHLESLRYGAVLRAFAIAGLVSAMLIAQSWVYGIVLIFHAVMGHSFAFLQISGVGHAVDMAGDRGAVGAYHATVALGVLLGSLTATFLAAVAGLSVAYAFAAVVTAVGCGLLIIRGPTAKAGAPTA